MQIRAFSFVAIVSVFAAGAVGACSSEVVTNNATTSTSSSSNTGTASTTTGVGGTGGIAGMGGAGGAGGAPTTSSSTTGGGDVCTQACDHAAQCGIDVCSQFMVDCNDPQQECLAQCLLPIPCNQLGQATIFACYSKCQGGTGGAGGGGGTGGGSPQACQNCAFSSCGAAVQACGGNAECGAWFQCVQNCMPGDSQCLFNCDMTHASAKPYYDAVYSCTCSKCSTECGSVFDPCNHVNMGTGGAGGAGGAGGMMPSP